MQAQPRIRRSWCYAVAAAIALAGAISLILQWSRTRPMWVDEEMIALNLRDRSLAELVGPLWMNQAAPLGWLWLQRLILLQFGTSERALRALPVAFGIATLAVALYVGRRWMGPVGAAIFVLLCSFAQFISYFPLEIKHYSADVFFGLLLPVLAVWAIESGKMRRAIAWWVIAAIAQWLANGAVFVVPGCALVICGLAWRRQGWRQALRVALPGVVWIASFALHYRLSIGPALQNQDLQNYWSGSLPPRLAGPASALRWLGAQFEPLALNPGGTRLWITFWVVSLGGLVLAAFLRGPAGVVLLTLPLSAFVLAGLGFVPLAGRLFLWALPALYAGIAVSADEALRFARRSLAYHKWLRMGAGLVGAAIAIGLSADIVRSGLYELSIQPFSKHNLDDRASLRYLMAQREPGDVLASTHMGLPAVWWYGGVNVAAPNLGHAHERDGGPVLEIRERSGGDCLAPNLISALTGRSRVAVYLGFDSRDPAGFQELVLDTLSELGRMTAYRRVAEDGVAAVFDLRQPPRPWTVIITRPGGQSLDEVPRPRGCAGFFPASRW